VLQKHKYKVLPARSCYACGSDKTYVRRDGRANWYTNKPTNLFLCAKCYQRENNRSSQSHHTRRIVFRLLGKGKRIQLEHNPRTGQCQFCGLEIGDSYLNCKGKKAIVKLTQIHHFAYHPDDPLKDTIELCGHCHGKESYRLGQLTGLVKGWRRR